MTKQLGSDPDWSEIKLYDGKRFFDDRCKVAPTICAWIKSRKEIMGQFDTADTHHVSIPREVGFFKLVPGTHLKAHTGPVNFHLYCHLGMIVPPGPKLRVGNVTTGWEEGKTLCFDDSYDHEAWHPGHESGNFTRYVMMATLLHPDLGEPDMTGKFNPENMKKQQEKEGMTVMTVR